MRGERRLRAVEDANPIWRLWAQLPPEWRGPVIGDGIDNWLDISENEGHRLILTGLPDVIAAEMAWMAHWQQLAFGDRPAHARDLEPPASRSAATSAFTRLN